MLSLSTHLNEASSGVRSVTLPQGGNAGSKFDPTMADYQPREENPEDVALNRMSSSATTPSTLMALLLTLLVALNITPVGAQDAQEESKADIGKANPEDTQGEPGER